MKSQEFLENTSLFQNLFSLKPEIKTEIQPKKMNRMETVERKLELYRQSFQLLREENAKLKAELKISAPSS
jgi:hypothetical protein